MKRNIWKKTAAIMAAGAVLLTGCGRLTQEGEAEDASTGMGRYVEQETPMDMGRIGSFTRLSDGRLALADLGQGPRISADEGKSWQPWLAESWADTGLNNSYNRIAAISPDGTVYVQYTSYDEAVGDSAGETMDLTEESLIKNLHHALLFPDGTVKKISVDNMEGFFVCCAFSPDGRLYTGSLNAIYEMNLEDGSLSRLFETEESIDILRFAGDRLLAFGASGVRIYDLEKRELSEADEVLNEFVRSKAEGRTTLVYTGQNAALLADGMEDGTVYLACSDGLYRHSLGGGTMEILIDGNLNTLGDVSAAKYQLLAGENEFLVAYGTMLAKYVYDPNVPTTPDRVLRVYGLRKDDCVRQAISIFQKEHQNVYVEYEEGLPGGGQSLSTGGQTEEDAVKKLNTEILAGKGPDVILLDGLPAASYMEKGLLRDLTALTQDLKGQCFDNMFASFQKDGKVFALPVKVKLPIMAGEEETLKQAVVLQSLTAAVRALRAGKPEGSVTQTFLPEETLRLLALTCAPAWTDGDDGINQENIREFLENALEIYAAEKSGVTERELEEFTESNYGSADGIVEEAYSDAAANILNVLLKDGMLAMGKVGAVQFGITNVVSVIRQKPELVLRAMAGQVPGVYEPGLIAGISSAAAEPELAEEFLKTLLSRKNQEKLNEYLPVNKEALNTVLTAPEDSGGTMGTMYLIKDDGTDVMMDCYYPSEAEKRQLTEIMEEVRTPYLKGGMLEEAVISAGVRVLNGEIDVETGMSQILEAVQLYMAE